MKNIEYTFKKSCSIFFSLLSILFFCSTFLNFSLKIVFLIWIVGIIGLALYQLGFKKTQLEEIQEQLETQYPDLLVISSAESIYRSYFFFLPFWPIIKIFEVCADLEKLFRNIYKFIIKK